MASLFRASPSTWRRELLRTSGIYLHGNVKALGYFYATLYLGTPARRFDLIVDTGSTMTYMPCADCGDGCGPNHQNLAYDPAASNTSERVACASENCQCGSPRCGCRDNGQTCTYQRSYAERSSSSGIMFRDVLALHDGAGPGVPVNFGCELQETGEIFRQQADGLIGLGQSDASVLRQLARAGVVQERFAMCFGSVDGRGALVLGGRGGDAAPAEAGATPMVRRPRTPFYYNVRIEALAVGGEDLGVGAAAFDQGYGAVMDSGTTFGYLPTPAYTSFVAAVTRHALARGLNLTDGPEPGFKDTCFAGAPEHHDGFGLAAVFPTLNITFGGGFTLSLGPLNYLFVHTFGQGKYCLGIFDNGMAGTVLGGIMFRNVLVDYDVERQRIGFAHADCDALGQRIRPSCGAFAAELRQAAQAAGDCSAEGASPGTREDAQGGEAEPAQAGASSSPSGPAAPAGVKHLMPSLVVLTTGLALVLGLAAVALGLVLRQRWLARAAGRGEEAPLVGAARPAAKSSQDLELTPSSAPLV